jgi:hypothetical protein
MKNPFAPDDGHRNLYLFAGGHTYGTVAAARFFTEQLRRDYLYLKRLYRYFNRFRTRQVRNIAFIISCDVTDEFPTNICLEREVQFEIE